jgi:uncharacterized protein (TIGR02001 family)
MNANWISPALLATTLSCGIAWAADTPEHSVTENGALYSQYIFRGLTQTDKHPAVQGGLDYAHASGFYAGLWGSNVSWISDFTPGVSASLELDTYLGYKMSFGEDWALDAGYLRYNYPGTYHGATKADTDELYAAGSWKWITLKYSYSLGNTFGVTDARGTSYLDLTAAIPLPAELTLTLHAGRQAYQGTSNGFQNDKLSYNDWKAELSWAFAKDWLLGGGYTRTDADSAYYTPVGTGRFIGGNLLYAYIRKSL